MGGVSTSYQNYLRQHVVKVSSNSEGDEYLVTRLENVEPALNIVNIYGQIEGRAGGKENLLESWGRILKELSMIEARGEGVLILGDLNRAVGSGELGVPGNSPTVSYGGKMVRDLLASEEYCLLNGLALAEGGPWTREDPGDGGLSCLDLAIVSRNMLPFVKKMKVDSKKEFTPMRVTVRRGRMTLRPTDLFSLLLELWLPRKEKSQKTLTVWNKKKPGGWEAYKVLTDAAQSKMEELIEDKEKSVEEVMVKLDKMQEKIKHATLGKSKVKVKKNTTKLPEKETMTDEEQAKSIMRKASEKIEKAIKEVSSINQGGCAKLFKMRDLVDGPKKAGQDAQAVEDSRSGELVVAGSAIRRVSLEYCLDTLRQNKPKEKFKQLIEVKQRLHDERMKEKDGAFDVTEDLFWQVLDKFKRKKKTSYDFLTKAGEGFQTAFWKFCRRMNAEESFPSRFDKTILVQLYKLKGPVQQLSSHRFIHMKEWAARLTEAIEVEGMKDDIINAGTKFQLGGKPQMRVQFQLFIVKSVVALKTKQKEGVFGG